MFSILWWVSFFILAGALSDRDELFSKYNEIFPNSNRNAASHRWATYILERSMSMTEKVLRDLFAGFCPISGSPLSYQRGVLRVQMTLPAVNGGNSTGMMYYCCTPCVCDTQDFLKVDTKTIRMADGERQLHFVVIGNPCEHSEKIPKQAPDVNCLADQSLVKATLSDHGHIIIGMFFEPGVADHSDSAAQKHLGSAFASGCEARAASGYRSGMGSIFRAVAAITPIKVSAAGLKEKKDAIQTPSSATATEAPDSIGNAATTTIKASPSKSGSSNNDKKMDNQHDHHKNNHDHSHNHNHDHTSAKDTNGVAQKPSSSDSTSAAPDGASHASSAFLPVLCNATVLVICALLFVIA